MLKDFLQNMRGKKEQLKELQTSDRLQTMVAERKKSSNERELERFMEEEREKQIKVDLNTFREQRKEEERKSSILSGPNIFKGEATVLNNNKKLLSNQNMFAGQSSMFNQKGGQFFK